MEFADDVGEQQSSNVTPGRSGMLQVVVGRSIEVSYSTGCAFGVTQAA